MNAMARLGRTALASPSRRKMLMIGVPVVLAAGAVVSVPLLIGSGGDSIRTSEPSSTVISSTTIADLDDIFSDGAPSNTVTDITTATTALPPSTLPATTSAPVTTIAGVDTLPEQPAQPIAPPADPRAPEDQIQLGSISIPSIGVDESLWEGITLTTLDNGPGHWPGTAMPGEVGNVVVAAHRVSHGGPFRNIDQLVAGDSVMFTTAAGEVEYKVTGTQIVNPDAVWIVDPTDTPTATLFACHPPGSVSQRIVVNLELATN
jgi:sortase A